MPNHTQTGLCTAGEFAHALELLDVTHPWTWDVRVERRAAMLVAGVIHHKKEGRRRGRDWRKGRLVAATTITNEIFMEGRAGHEPLEGSDVFQAEATLLLNIGFNIIFSDIEAWTGFDCAAPHVMGQEVTTSSACWNMRRKTRFAAMEYVMVKPMCVEKPPWTVATMLHVQFECCLLFLKLGGKVERGMGAGNV